MSQGPFELSDRLRRTRPSGMRAPETAAGPVHEASHLRLSVSESNGAGLHGRPAPEAAPASETSGPFPQTDGRPAAGRPGTGDPVTGDPVTGDSATGGQTSAPAEFSRPTELLSDSRHDRHAGGSSLDTSDPGGDGELNFDTDLLNDDETGVDFQALFRLARIRPVDGTPRYGREAGPWHKNGENLHHGPNGATPLPTSVPFAVPERSPRRAFGAPRQRMRPSLRIVGGAEDERAHQTPEDLLPAPDRNYDCPHYDTCLGLAAAFDWSSFTCHGCSGMVNEQLIWRAHQRLKGDRTLAALCALPELHAKPDAAE